MHRRPTTIVLLACCLATFAVGLALSPWLHGSVPDAPHLTNSVASSEPSAPDSPGTTESDAESEDRRVLARTDLREEPATKPFAAARFPHIDDFVRLQERLASANAEEWERIGVDICFAGIFGQLEQRGAERPVDLSRSSVNPGRRALSVTETNALNTYVEGVSREIYETECFYQVERYHAFVSSLGHNRTIYESPDKMPADFEEARVEHERQRAFIEELARPAGGVDAIDYFMGTAYPGEDRPRSLDEWKAMRTAGTLRDGGTRMYHFSKVEAPGVFAAKEQLEILRQRREEMARAFIESLPR